ncbi:MAG TPA: type II CAAX endopeptidase family protein [Candidatus Acidoferrales bacterium]|nr:type II CAAX endopeptidase family protein [Candidatus Acidoferrales bacterium]
MHFAHMHWDYILILSILAVVVPWRSSSRIRGLLDGPELASSERILLYLSTIGFQWAAVAVILWRSRAHLLSWAALGIALPHPFRAVAVAVGVSVILVFNQIYGMRRVAALPYENRGLVAKLAEKLLPSASNEIFVAILLVATVAVCEEFIYRGFVEAIFANVFSGSELAGAIISATFFSLAHLYQGRKGLVTTFAVGLIFSAARIWTGSLLPSMVIHFAVDFAVGLAAVRFLPLRRSGVALAALFLPRIFTGDGSCSHFFDDVGRGR